MIRAIRLAFARRAFEQANAAYVAYQRQPAGFAWRLAVADALHVRLIRAERHLSQLINA